MSDTETEHSPAKIEAWTKINSDLKSKFHAQGTRLTTVDKYLEPISTDILALTEKSREDEIPAYGQESWRETMKLMMECQDALEVIYSRELHSHLDALGACWDSVGGEPE